MLDKGIQFADTYSRLSKLAKTNMGRDFIGHLAQPVFTDIREIEHAKLREDIDDHKPKDPPDLLTKIQDGFMNNFAWGDLLTVGGVGLLTIQNKLFPTKNPTPGFVEKTFRAVSLALTFGGSISAMIGRMFDLHRSTALGDKYAEALLEAAEKQGRKIFKEYSPEQIHTLIKDSEKLDKLLVYPSGLKELILERHAKDEIGGIFDGKPGTGKTEGVRCILGKWAKKLISEGKEPIIAELNLANFYDYLKEINQKKMDAVEVLKVGTNADLGDEPIFADNQGLLVLELLVKKIQRMVNKVNRENQNSGKKAELAVFVDEFDKIFDAHTLKGCDKARLKNLILQFNDLFVKNNLLLTSNTSLEEIIEELKKHLASKDNPKGGEEVWKPMYSRFSSKNRALVELPGFKEQAEIIAARLLDKHRAVISWTDFGMPQNGSGNNDLDRKQLAESISEYIKTLDLSLDGRQLAYACDDLNSMLLGRARELRLEANNSIPDSTWDKLSTTEKILKTGAVIDKDLLQKTLAAKAMSSRLETYDKDRELATSLLSNYFNHKETLPLIKDSIKNNEVNQASLLNLLAEIFTISPNGNGDKSYITKHKIKQDGNECHYFISRREPSVHSGKAEPKFKFTVAFAGSSKSTREFTLSELVSVTNAALANLNGDGGNKALSDILGLAKTIIQAGDKPDAGEKIINGIEKILKQDKAA